MAETSGNIVTPIKGAADKNSEDASAGSGVSTAIPPNIAVMLESKKFPVSVDGNIMELNEVDGLNASPKRTFLRRIG